MTSTHPLSQNSAQGTKPVDIAESARRAQIAGADSFPPERTDEKVLEAGMDVKPLSEVERLKATKAFIKSGIGACVAGDNTET